MELEANLVGNSSTAFDQMEFSKDEKLSGGAGSNVGFLLREPSVDSKYSCTHPSQLSQCWQALEQRHTKSKSILVPKNRRCSVLFW